MVLTETINTNVFFSTVVTVDNNSMSCFKYLSDLAEVYLGLLEPIFHFGVSVGGQRP